MMDIFVIIITTRTDIRLKTVYNYTSPVTCKLVHFKLLQFKLHTSAQLHVTYKLICISTTHKTVLYIFFPGTTACQPVSQSAHSALVNEQVPWFHV